MLHAAFVCFYDVTMTACVLGELHCFAWPAWPLLVVLTAVGESYIALPGQQRPCENAKRDGQQHGGEFIMYEEYPT